MILNLVLRYMYYKYLFLLSVLLLNCFLIVLLFRFLSLSLHAVLNFNAVQLVNLFIVSTFCALRSLCLPPGHEDILLDFPLEALLFLMHIFILQFLVYIYHKQIRYFFVYFWHLFSDVHRCDFCSELNDRSDS